MDNLVFPNDSASNVGGLIVDNPAAAESYKANCKKLIGEWWSGREYIKQLEEEIEKTTHELTSQLKDAKKKLRATEKNLLPFFTHYESHVLKDTNTGKHVSILSEEKEVLPTTGKIKKMLDTDSRLNSTYKNMYEALIAELKVIKSVKKMSDQLPVK